MFLSQPVGVVAGVLQQELQVALGQAARANHVAHVLPFFQIIFLFLNLLSDLFADDWSSL